MAVPSSLKEILEIIWTYLHLGPLDRVKAFFLTHQSEVKCGEVIMKYIKYM